MKSLRPRTTDAGLFIVLIASNEELGALIEAVNVASQRFDDDRYTNLRVDLMQARYGRKNATRSN